jgi:hypothetical protein
MKVTEAVLQAVSITTYSEVSNIKLTKRGKSVKYQTDRNCTYSEYLALCTYIQYIYTHIYIYIYNIYTG